MLLSKSATVGGPENIQSVLQRSTCGSVKEEANISKGQKVVPADVAAEVAVHFWLEDERSAQAALNAVHVLST